MENRTPRTADSTVWPFVASRKIVDAVVPYLFDNTVNVLGRRVGCYSFDQFAAEIALDHLCITK